MSKDRGRTALALALAFSCVGVADARPAAAETILVRFRFPVELCAGVCPNFEMKVSPDGDVVTRDLFRHQTYRFRATLGQLSAFRQKLDALRPTREKRLDSKCEIRGQDGKPEPLAPNPRPDDFEVRWTGGRSEARLTGCYFGHWPMHVAVEDALRALGANPIFGWDKRLDPCGPGRHPKPEEEANRSWDAAHPGERGDKTDRLSVSICRP